MTSWYRALAGDDPRQLIGPPGGEKQLIALGRVIEAALT